MLQWTEENEYSALEGYFNCIKSNGLDLFLYKFKMIGRSYKHEKMCDQFA